MINSLDKNVKINELKEFNSETVNKYNISYRGIDYERVPASDSFESKNKNTTGKTVGLIAVIATLSLSIVGGICLHKGAKVLEGKDARLDEKIKEGWKELWGRGNKKVPEDTNKPKLMKTIYQSKHLKINMKLSYMKFMQEN